MAKTTSLLTVKTLCMPALPSSGGSSLAQSFHRLGGGRNLAGMPAGPDIIARGALRPDLVNVGFTAPPGGIPAQSEEVNRAIEGTYLCTAACNSGTMKLLYLLGCGADPNIHNAKGIYPLHYAIKRLNLRMVRALMRHSAPAGYARGRCRKDLAAFLHKQILQNGQSLGAHSAASREKELLGALGVDVGHLA